MRVLHLVSYAVFSGPVPGVVGLARAQRDAGCEAYVAHDTLRGPFSPYEEAISPAHLDRGALQPPLALAVSPRAAPWHFVADVVRLRRFFGQRAVDVVHVHQSHDHWLLSACGAVAATRVRTVHADRALRPRFGQRWLWRHIDGVVVRTCAHGLALSAAGVAPALPRALVPGAVDGQFWRPCAEARAEARAAVRRGLGIPAQVPLLLHVGLMAGRGQIELLRALELLIRHGKAGAAHLALVGRGPDQACLAARAQAGALAGRVHLVGYLEAPALRALYQVSDAAFVAQAGNDAAARAALEAMACGLPVVAVQHGALEALVDDVVGYPVASRTPQEVACGLAAWLQDLPRGRARGRAARRRMLRQRTFAQEAQATLALYRRAAEAAAQWRPKVAPPL